MTFLATDVLHALTAPAAALDTGEVRVWIFPSVLDELPRELWVAQLLPAEVAQLERMRAGAPAEQFLAGRACLRLLLGVALGQAPCYVRLTAGSHGKLWTTGVEFNVSHSHGQVAIALCRDAAVGIDLEWMDPTIEALEIAAGSFTPAEMAALSHAGADRVSAFYRCWTRKEAVVKAHGQGLTVPLGSFAVSCSAEALEREALLPDRTLWVRGLPAPAGFAAALAVTKPGRTVHMLQLQSLLERHVC